MENISLRSESAMLRNEFREFERRRFVWKDIFLTQQAVEPPPNTNNAQGSDTPLVVKFADNRKARKTMGRGRWRGDLMPHYGMPSGGYQDMRHGHPNAHPYHSNYYPSPISSYQPHPHAGTRWHGWAPVYLDTPSYYGGPNSGEMYHNSHMQYASPSMPYFGRGPPMQPRTVSCLEFQLI